MSQIKNVDDIPEKYRSIFQPIKQFNQIQSELYDDLIETSDYFY